MFCSVYFKGSWQKLTVGPIWAVYTNRKAYSTSYRWETLSVCRRRPTIEWTANLISRNSLIFQQSSKFSFSTMSGTVVDRRWFSMTSFWMIRIIWIHKVDNSLISPTKRLWFGVHFNPFSIFLKYMSLSDVVIKLGNTWYHLLVECLFKTNKPIHIYIYCSLNEE